MSTEYDGMSADREALLAAWEQQFPTVEREPEEDYDPHVADGWDYLRRGEALMRDPTRARYVREAAAQVEPLGQIGAPLTANTVSLTRGDQARGRYEELRAAVAQAQDDPFGDADIGEMEREMREITDGLIELEHTGQADERVINLSRGREARTIYGPRVTSPMRPTY